MNGYGRATAFHRHGDVPRYAEASRHRRVTWRLHPALTSVLNRLQDTAVEQAFTDRAVEVSTSKVLGGLVDHNGALVAHRWVLKRVDGDGLPLTAAGYLKPADVQELAALMPAMSDWPHSMTREIDVHPVLRFREYLKSVGLLRKYKGTLRATRAGRVALSDPHKLWKHLADTILLTGSDFDTDASVVVVIHMATTDNRIDVQETAHIVTALGWSHSDGTSIGSDDIYPIWNELWHALGNVGERVTGKYSDRTLSDSARLLIAGALFEEVNGDEAG